MSGYKAIVPISKLKLDTENPRLPSEYSDQATIIQYLLENEKVENLAKDIAQRGANPFDMIGVLKNPENEGDDEYIILEGNRRICALMLLNNPDLAPNERLKKQFQRFKVESVVPETVMHQKS